MALIGSKKRRRAAQLALAARAAKAVKDARASDDDPADAGRSGGRLRWFLLGTAAGAAAWYFLDPVSGRSRRVRTTEQAAAGVRRPVQQAADELQRTATVARDKAVGVAHEVTTSEEDAQPADDRALADKVRSEALGGQAWRDATINVAAVDGVVTLRGQLPSRQRITDAVDAVRAVPGVERVESFLHTPGSEAPNVADVREVRPTR